MRRNIRAQWCVAATCFLVLESLDGASATEDKRFKVDTSLEEYGQLQAIGILHADSMEGYGTGVLVSTCHVLTNHHVAFAGDNAAPILNARLNFRFNVDAAGRFRNQARGVVIAHSAKFSRSRNRHDDWAVIKLNSSQTDVKPLEMIGVTYDRARNFNLHVFGFPLDRLKSTLRFHVWGQTCRVVLEDPDTGWLSDCVVSPGASGSAVTASGKRDGVVSRYLIGIVAAAVDYARSEGTSTQSFLTPTRSIVAEVRGVMDAHRCE